MSKVRKYKYYLALSDFLILGLAAFFSVSFMGSNDVLNLAFLDAGSQSGFRIYPFLLAGVVYLIVSETSQLYKPSIILRQTEHTNAVIKALLFTATGLIIISLFLAFSSFFEAGILIGSFTVTAFLLLYIYRVKIVTPYYINNIEVGKNILFVGDILESNRLAAQISKGSRQVNIVGFINTNNIQKININSEKILGSLDQLDEIVKQRNVNEIVIVHTKNDYEELFNIVSKCGQNGLEIKVCSPLFKIVNQKLQKNNSDTLPLINLCPKSTFYTKYGKRAVDIVGALIGLALLSPLFFILAALIKATSAGPVFFKQMRVGKSGDVFKFYKFRSMYQVAEEDKERAEIMKEFLKKDKIESGDAKVVNTARVTKVGKVIRKTSVDELPQFYNVLKGDMSLVGPRPEVPYVYEFYQDWQKGRVAGLPGCTGVWQVTARSLVTFNEMVILDIYYLSNISFLLDMKMIFKTIPVMLFSKGGR